MFWVNLGLRCKKYGSCSSLLLKGVSYLLPAMVVFCVLPTNAAYVCQQYESCAMINKGYYWERVCKPAQNCTWVPDAPSSPPSPSPSPSPSPQAQPPVQPPPPQSPSKECLLLEAQIEHYYLQCTADAKRKFVENSALCPPSTSNTVEGGVNGPVSGSASNTTSPNSTCVSGHMRVQGADMGQCAANRAALNINYVNQCK